MGSLKDEPALNCYREVLLKLGHISGYIQWKRLPLDWLSENLPEATVKLVHELMAQHVRDGGKIHQIEETRPDHLAWRFHYDLRLPISGRRIYLETVLDQAPDIEDCTIWVVNMKDQ